MQMKFFTFMEFVADDVNTGSFSQNFTTNSLFDHVFVLSTEKVCNLSVLAVTQITKKK